MRNGPNTVYSIPLPHHALGYNCWLRSQQIHCSAVATYTTNHYFEFSQPQCLNMSSLIWSIVTSNANTAQRYRPTEEADFCHLCLTLTVYNPKQHPASAPSEI